MKACTRKRACKPKLICRKSEIRCGKTRLKWVTLGDRNRQTKNNGEIYVKINQTFTHPKMHQPSPPNGIFQYDVTVLELDECVDLKPHIRIVCLPDHNMETYEGETVNVIGWGHLAYKDSDDPSAGKYSAILQEITIRVFSNEECEKRSSVFNSEFIICAGNDFHWREDACQGDSGGNCYFDNFNIPWFRI